MISAFLFPVVVTLIPSFISARYFFYLTHTFLGGDRRGREMRFDAVMGALAGTVTCLLVLGIFLIAEQTTRNLSIESIVFTQDYYHIIDRTLIAGIVCWLLVLFFFMINNVARTLLMRSIIQTYIVLYFILKYVPNRASSPMKILSYAYHQLAEIFVSGVSFDAAAKSPTLWPEKLLDFVFYFICTYTVLRYVANLIIYVHGRRSSNEGPFDLEAIVVALNAFIWIAATMLSLGMLNVELGGLGLTTGLIAAGLTISFRDLLNNFFSGILLNLDKSIKMRDLIRMSDGVIGEVKKISLRYTYLETRDNVDILVPNSILIQNRFENLTRTQQEVRLTLRFSVGRDADIDNVERLALRACMNVPEVVAVTSRLPAVFYVGVSDSSHVFDLKFWVSDPRPGPPKLQSDVAKHLYRVFKAAQIPLPIIRQMFVHDTKQETLWPIAEGPKEVRRSVRRPRRPGRRTD